MASLENTRSVQSTSDETFTYTCDPCNFDGVERQATRFCNDCQEYLCINCTESHKRFKRSRNHTILMVNEIPSRPDTSSAETVINKILCTCDQSLEVILYCEDHKDLICSACKNLKHRNCAATSLSNKSTTFAETNLKETLNKVEKLKKEFERLSLVKTSELQELFEMKDNCTKEVKRSRNELGVFLDQLEYKFLNNLYAYENQRQNDIQSYIDTCSTTIKMIDADLELLINAEKDDKVAVFASVTKVSNRLTEYESLFFDVQDRGEPELFYFEENKQITDLQKDVDSLGKLIVKTKKQPNWHKNVLQGKNFVASKKVNIRFQDDKNIPWITGCTFLPKGQLLLCDHDNNKLKMLNRSLEPAGCLTLVFPPWDVSVINSLTVVISQPDRMCLQVVEVSPALKAGSVIHVDKKCFGVSVFGDDIYVACHNAPGEGEVRVVGCHGNVKKNIGNYLLLMSPSYIATSSTTGLIYIADWHACLLFCIDAKGKIVYQERHSALKEMKGIYVDDEGSVIICSRGTNNLYILSPDGKRCNRLLADNNSVAEPYSIGYRAYDNTLVVGCNTSENLYVYNIE